MNVMIEFSYHMLHCLLQTSHPSIVGGLHKHNCDDEKVGCIHQITFVTKFFLIYVFLKALHVKNSQKVGMKY